MFIYVVPELQQELKMKKKMKKKKGWAMAQNKKMNINKIRRRTENPRVEKYSPLRDRCDASQNTFDSVESVLFYPQPGTLHYNIPCDSIVIYQSLLYGTR